MTKKNEDSSIQSKTFFDTEHDNFKIDESISIPSTDVDDSTAEEETEEETEAAENITNEEEEEGAEGDTSEEEAEEEGAEAAEGTEEEEEEEEESEEFSYSPLVTDLLDEGVLDVDDVEKYEDSPEGFRQLVDDTVKKKFEGLVKGLSPEAQRLIEIEQAGGNIHKLLEMESVDYENIDLEDVDNQKTLIKDKLEIEGYTEEEIEERLQDLEDLGKLAKESKIAHRYLAKKSEDEKKAYHEEVRKQNETAELQKVKQVEEFRAKVLEVKEVAGIKLNKKDTEKLYDYIATPVAREKGTGKLLTQYEIDSSFDNKLKQAYFQMVGYDFSNIEKKAATKVNLKVKKVLANYKDKNTQGSTFVRPQEKKETTKIPNFWEGDRNNML